jgi:hypothetical protein
LNLRSGTLAGALVGALAGGLAGVAVLDELRAHIARELLGVGLLVANLEGCFTGVADGAAG